LKLSVAGKWLNHCLWLIAVKERSEVLPAHWDATAVTRFGQLTDIRRTRLVQQWDMMVQLGLIEIMPDKRIKVCGVTDCHNKLNWKPYGKIPHTSPKRVLKEKDKEKDTDIGDMGVSGKEKKVPERVLKVFDHYHKVFGKGQSYRLTDQRIKLIQESFKRGYTAEELMTAIDGMSKDPWPERHKHSDLLYAIGVVGKIDMASKWCEIENKPSKLENKTIAEKMENGEVIY